MDRPILASGTPCNIVAVGRRRDGGTRYWCLEHGADATAKYGRRAPRCRYSHVLPVRTDETKVVALEKYPGGIGVWGAVPPVFDTTVLGLDRGIHVHARRTASGKKDIDDTFRRVLVHGDDLSVEINELDAIYFMVSTVFDKSPQEVVCAHCQTSHLDKDWFSVHPHTTHLCSACGKLFRDTKVAVGNPAARATKLLNARRMKPARKSITLRQRDYPGGLRIWGSNPAIIWTAAKPERSGIHVHAYGNADVDPEVDDTFAAVTVDGVCLDPVAVRVYMAQMALPHLAGRIVAATCRVCGSVAFDRDDDAFTPLAGRACPNCHGRLEAESRYRKVISNPLIGALRTIARHAVRRPKNHDLHLLPETL